MSKRVKEWQNYYQQRGNMHTLPLSYRDGGDFIIIRQEQMHGVVLNHKLKGLSRKIYLYCEEIQKLVNLCNGFPTISHENLENFLAEMVDKKLMFREDDQLISLAIHNKNWE